MADTEKKARGKGDGEHKVDRRRLAYLKQRSKELKKEMQANKEESNALRTKLGGAAKGKKKKGGGGDDDEE